MRNHATAQSAAAAPVPPSAGLVKSASTRSMAAAAAAAATAAPQAPSSDAVKFFHVTKRVFVVPNLTRATVPQLGEALRGRFARRFLIWNFSGWTYDSEPLGGQVIDVPNPRYAVPTLDMLWHVSNSMQQWLGSDSHNVVLIHCRPQLSVAPLVAACYVHFRKPNMSGTPSVFLDILNSLSVEGFAVEIQRAALRFANYFDLFLAEKLRAGDGLRMHGLLNKPSRVLRLDTILVKMVPLDVTFGMYQPLVQIYQIPSDSLFTSSWQNLSSFAPEDGFVALQTSVKISGDILIVFSVRRNGTDHTIFTYACNTSYIEGTALHLSAHDLDGELVPERFAQDTFVDLIMTEADTESDEAEPAPDVAFARRTPGKVTALQIPGSPTRRGSIASTGSGDAHASAAAQAVAAVDGPAAGEAQAAADPRHAMHAELARMAARRLAAAQAGAAAPPSSPASAATAPSRPNMSAVAAAAAAAAAARRAGSAGPTPSSSAPSDSPESSSSPAPLSERAQRTPLAPRLPLFDVQILSRTKRSAAGPELRRVHWTRVSRESSSSLWGRASALEVQLDTGAQHALQRAFTIQRHGTAPAAGTSASDAAASAAAPTLVRLLEARRRTNVGIVLRTLERHGHDELVQSVARLDREALTQHVVRSLLAVCPTPEEAALIRNFRGRPEMFDAPERFFLLTLSVPDYHTKLSLLDYTFGLSNAIASIEQQFAEVRAVIEAMRSEHVIALLRVLLECGNFLNRGTRLEDAHGFALAGLDAACTLRTVAISGSGPDQVKLSLFEVAVAEADASGSADWRAAGALLAKVENGCLTPINDAIRTGRGLMERFNEFRSVAVAHKLPDVLELLEQIQAPLEALGVSIKQMQADMDDALRFLQVDVATQWNDAVAPVHLLSSALKDASLPQRIAAWRAFRTPPDVAT